jgi:stage IV sporulation protein FB
MTTGLSFRLFRIPFRVQVWFFVTILLINLARLSPFSLAPIPVTVYFLEGMAAAALVIVVHELGHCLTYRRYGQEPSVLLWGLGGLTFGTGRLPPRKSIVVSVAGIGLTLFVFAVPAYLLRRYVIGYGDPMSLLDLPQNILGDLFTYTVWWAIFNILPILPLDGGHVVEAVLEWVTGSPQKQKARLISGVAGITLGLLALVVLFNPFLMLMLVMLGVLNLLPWYAEQNNQPVRYALPDHDDGASVGFEGGTANVVSMEKARKKRDRRSPAELIKAGYEALERREYKAALRISDRLQSKRLNAELDRWTAELAAFAWLGDRNPVRAEEMLNVLPRGANVSTPLAAVLAIANKRTDDGMRLMVQCMVNEPEGGPKLIAVDLFAEYGMIHRLARDLVDQPGGSGFEAAVSLEGMLHRLHRTQDASTVSDVILLG